jgi:recombination protein RecT
MQSTTQLQCAHENLDNLLESKNDALPSGFNKVRFLQNSMAYLADNIKDIQKYKVEDIAVSLFKGAVLGLDFLNKECHVVTEGTTVTFQTDYKGEKKLAKKYSVRPVLDIYAKNVRQGDEFREEIKGGKPTVSFSPLAFNNSPIIGTFAVALFEDGGMVYETLTSEELELIRKSYGKNPNSQAWDNSQGEMYKRTALRRLCKNIELDFDTDQTLAFEDGGAFEFNREPRIIQQSPFNIKSDSKEVPHATEQG